MLSEKHIDAVKDTAEELKRRREHRPQEALRDRPEAVGGAPKAQSHEISQEDADRMWARENLRFRGETPYLDVANALRVFERHEVFAGRFKFNETLGKVLDKGTVMIDWRVAEVVAVIQDRFLPEIPEAVVSKALIVHANRVMEKK